MSSDDEDDGPEHEFNIIMHEIAPEVLKCLCTPEMSIRLAHKDDYKKGYKNLKIINPKTLGWKF